MRGERTLRKHLLARATAANVAPWHQDRCWRMGADGVADWRLRQGLLMADTCHWPAAAYAAHLPACCASE
eukprot:2599089-Prymnesium_polylepis.2